MNQNCDYYKRPRLYQQKFDRKHAPCGGEYPVSAQPVLCFLAGGGFSGGELCQLLLRLVHQLYDGLPGVLVGLPLGHTAEEDTTLKTWLNTNQST